MGADRRARRTLVGDLTLKPHALYGYIFCHLHLSNLGFHLSRDHACVVLLPQLCLESQSTWVGKQLRWVHPVYLLTFQL